jgi:lysophospholipase
MRPVDRLSHAIQRGSTAAAAALALVGFAGVAFAAAGSSSFETLEHAGAGASPYRLTVEADLAPYAGWSDIEAATLQQAELSRGSFTGAQGVKIHYRLYRHRAESRGGVVVAAGRTEGLVMYQELIRDLVHNGYSVYIHDHRGQGFSQRLLTSDPTMGYVDEFDYYVQDLAAFVDGPVGAVRAAPAAAGRPLFLIAHSMGGAVSALYLGSGVRSPIAAAALVTPMMEPWTAGGNDPGLVARLADAFCDASGVPLGPLPWLSESYADGADFDTLYAGVRLAPPDAPNDLTHSAGRFLRHWQARDQARCEGADCGSADAKVGGVSLRWFNQACQGSGKARNEAAARIQIPVLLLQGSRDTVVKPQAQKTFCMRLNGAQGSGYCVGRTVPGARHALLIEADAHRLPALRRVLGFFDCVRSGAQRCN